MIIYVDIDHTICYYNSDPKSMKYKEALPYTDRISRINNLVDKGHRIIYWTARGTLTNISWFKETLFQLEKWNCKFHELRMGKPVYDLFIDDKNISSDAFFNENYQLKE